MAKETREPYQWRSEETRDSGPVDKSYDPMEAQKRREAGRVPEPEVPPAPPKPPYKQHGTRSNQETRRK